MRDDDRAPAEGDDDGQRVVLRRLLDEHPSWLTVDELALTFEAGEPAGRRGVARDQAARAVRDLVAHGLVHRVDRFVVVTAAARRCAALLEDG